MRTCVYPEVVMARAAARAQMGRRAEISARRDAVGAERELRERRQMSALLLPVRGDRAGPRSWIDLVPSRL